MNKTETKARAGEDLSPVLALKRAVTGFIEDFGGFQSAMEAKLKQTEERLCVQINGFEKNANQCCTMCV